MKVHIIYRGGEKNETLLCKECYPHTAGGWMLKDIEGSSKSLFIGSCDVRSIEFIDDYKSPS